MKKHLCVLLIFWSLGYMNLHAQVGQFSNKPNKDAALDLNRTDGTNNKGLLLPKVALTSTSSASPMTAHVAGMKVYNTASAGTGTNAVTPGEYVNDGSKWIRAISSAWTLEGNSNTTASNSLGTTDAVDFITKTNNIEAIRVTSTGKVLIGTTAIPTGGTTSKMIIDNGTTAGAIQLKDGTEGLNKFLVSDANGLGTWKTVTPKTNNVGTWLMSSSSNYFPTAGTIESGTSTIDTGNTISGLTAVTNGVRVPEGTYMVYITHDLGGNEYGRYDVLTNTGTSVFFTYYLGWLGGAGFYLKVPTGGLTLQSKFTPNPYGKLPMSNYYLREPYTTNFSLKITFLKIN